MIRPIPDRVLREVDRLVAVVGDRYRGFAFDVSDRPVVDVLGPDNLTINRFVGSTVRQALRLAREAAERGLLRVDRPREERDVEAA